MLSVCSNTLDLGDYCVPQDLTLKTLRFARTLCIYVLVVILPTENHFFPTRYSPIGPSNGSKFCL